MYLGLEILGEAFLEWLKVKAFTPATRKSYRIYVNKFLKYLESENIESVEAISPAILYQYQTQLYYANSKYGKPLSVLTQHNALVVVKTFFEFLLETDKIQMDPSSALALPKKPQSLPDTMTPEEIECLIERPDCTNAIGFRNRAIMEVLYATGMRNSELCSLEVYDVNLASEEIRIRFGKGGKERIVPIGEMAREYLSEYLTAVRPKLIKTGTGEQTLFVSKSGKKINATDLVMMVRKYAKEAGIEKRITPHTFRHTCATHMLQGGADIRYIQTLLGHESITSTQLYTHVEITDLKEIHKKYHPRERKDHADN
ncbi:tyrosine-type recombinase/integrase [bacterium]|nr:tyrosine-type recombinase/integrase [bacterium]